MSCTAPNIIVDGVILSTNTFQNAQELISEVGSDQSDPTADEYEGYIANGNNNRNSSGIHQSLPTQTSLPTPSPWAASESNTSAPPVITAAGVTCTIWDGINYNAPMSANFTLKNYTIGAFFPHPLISFGAYTAQARFCNLQALSLRVMEPLYAKFGTFRINCGIRNQNSVAAPGLSQHVTGEAADIQFPNWTYSTYWQNAQWIKDNIPYDQFIFEHSEKTRSAWLHLSFRQSGNRPVNDRTKVMTMYRGHFDSGLKKYY